ncbi:MAG: T9SS type A sorting domain-containing protein, partial [Bacteroidetes bacterium]|nr:T9SS type A sorting domain-containing protein [Bacteroidota bacterium]
SGTHFLTALSLDAFFATYSANGKLLFANIISGTDNITGEGIAIGQDDHIYLTGNFTKTADFDPSSNTSNLTTAGQQNVYIAKYDSLGNYVWSHFFPSNGSNAAFDIMLGSKEQIYISGAFQNTTDFDPGSATVNRKSAGADDGFVVKLDSAGNFKWVNSFGAGNNNVDQAHAVHVINNRVYVAGGFGGSVDFDPSSSDSTLIAQFPNDIFLVVYDTLGRFKAARQVKGQGYGRALSQYANAVYLGGDFRASADFNPSPEREEIENAGGLDDMFILKLADKIICTAPSDSMTVTVCGPYFSRRGKFYHQTGRYIDSIYSKDGCDSVFITNLTLLKSDTTIIANVCDSFVSPQGKVFRKSGTYIDTFSNILGCDSLVTMKVSILSTDSTLDTTHCGPFTSFSGKHIYTVSGTYIDTILNSASCDSVITINLIVLNTFDSVSIIETCDSFRTPLSNQLVLKSGVYYDSLKTVEGCDSVFTWNITINNTGDYFDTLTVCDSFVSPLGITYTQSGIYIDSMQSSNGCDSVITSVVTINKSSFSTLKTRSCQQFVSFSGRDTFYSSGTYQDTIINGSGCDSVITIELEILEPTDTQYVVTVCDSFVSPAGRVLKGSGKISDTLTNANGCDSIIDIDVNVNYSAQNSISLSECSQIKSPSGKFELTATGIYYDTLQTKSGCDSIITINFTLKANTSSFSVNGKTLTADSVGGQFTYQWLTCSGTSYSTISGATTQQYVATESGNYALALSRENCWDTSACKYVEVGAVVQPNEQIAVFPNPSEGFVQITAQSKIENVSVYSSNLKLMNCHINLKGEKGVANLAELPKGVYILKVQTENGIATTLVAKN